jgi:hypothetical protein
LFGQASLSLPHLVVPQTLGRSAAAVSPLHTARIVTRRPPRPQLPRRLPPRPPRRLAHAQRQLVGHRRRPVRIHRRHQQPLPPHLEGLLVAGLLRPAQLLQALSRIRRHALPRDLVLPDSRAHCRPPQGPRACLGLTLCLVGNLH